MRYFTVNCDPNERDPLYTIYAWPNTKVHTVSSSHPSSSKISFKVRKKNMQPSATTLHSASRKFIKLSTDFRRHRLLIVAVVVVVVHSSLCSVLCYLLVFPCSILSFVICFFVVVERNWPLCAFFQFREGYLPLNQITSIRGKTLSWWSTKAKRQSQLKSSWMEGDLSLPPRINTFGLDMMIGGVCRL